MNIVRRISWVPFAIVLLSLCAPAISRAAVPASETLLPNTTKGFVSVASVDQMREAWNKTQLGQLSQDPLMKPFVEDLRRQLQEKWTQTHQKLGLTFDDLDGVPSGEVALAFILHSPTEVASVVLADVTDHKAQSDALLAKIDHNMAARKAVRSQRKVAGADVVVFDIPRHDDVPARQMAYTVHNDLLAATDNVRVLESILGRVGHTKDDSLAAVPAFQAVLARCKAAAGDLAPHARWFVEPIGYADAMRVSQPKKRGTDMLKILKTEGFTAVQGLGGFVNFSANQYELLHHTFIFAPGNPTGERFSLAARMLNFPNGGTFSPANWVPRDIATYAALNVDTKNAFESSKTLVNQVVGD